MIGDHPRHVHVQQPATLAEQQVVQAVAVLRHQDQHAAAPSMPSWIANPASSPL